MCVTHSNQLDPSRSENDDVGIWSLWVRMGSHGVMASVSRYITKTGARRFPDGCRDGAAALR